MNTAAWAWWLALATLSVVAGYEAWLWHVRRVQPEHWARSAHESLREDWFAALSAQPGSEILAVQTLRNSLMSATMTASTAALALMGTVTLAAPSLHEAFADAASARRQLTPTLAMELVLLALLFASLVASVMAVRYYNHASFVGGMPVDSAARKHWNPAGIAYVRQAGVLYSRGLRRLVLVAPVVAFQLHPVAGPVTAIFVVTGLYSFDRFTASDPARPGTGLAAQAAGKPDGAP